MTNGGAKVRRGTFADLRGTLSSRVKKQPTNEKLRQWIDEARSRALPDILKNRKASNTQDREE
jgi:hypothetical protein